MSKSGWSEECEGSFGNKYTQHYDADGNKSGWSEDCEGLLGGNYTQHYDTDGDKAGWSEDCEGFFGGEYTQHYDTEADKSGRSQGDEGFFGGEYTQHYDAGKDKAGWSEECEGFFGGKNTQHYDTKSRATTQSSDYSPDSEDFVQSHPASIPAPEIDEQGQTSNPRVSKQRGRGRRRTSGLEQLAEAFALAAAVDAAGGAFDYQGEDDKWRSVSVHWSDSGFTLSTVTFKDEETYEFYQSVLKQLDNN